MKIWLNTRINYSTFVAGQKCTSHSWCAAKYSNTDVMVKMDFKNIFVYLYSILREGVRESVYTHANIHTHLYLVAIWSQTVYLLSHLWGVLEPEGNPSVHWENMRNSVSPALRIEPGILELWCGNDFSCVSALARIFIHPTNFCTVYPTLGCQESLPYSRELKA